MAAYAALLSLSKVIDLIMLQNKANIHVCSREQMMSLHGKIDRLENLLEDLSGRSHSSIDFLESRIRDVAYQLEDVIEDDISTSLFEKLMSLSTVKMNSSKFRSCAIEISILLEEAMAMKENNLQNEDASGPRDPLTTSTSSSDDQPPSAKLHLNEDLNEIMDRIIRRGSKLEVIPITGMGGIGKTTLARAVYEHPRTLCHFDICSWITVSQQFNVKEILRGLLPTEQQNTPDEKLIEFVHKRLIGRRFLIVLDDMWDEKAWDGVRNAFPDDNKGSRVILTTRLLVLAKSVGSSDHVHQIQFLNDEQSWDLLREKVGRDNHWSTELEVLGRTISKNCRGLPLAVVSMSGLLKFNMTAEYWERVARDTKSETTANYDDHLLSILALSYTDLPPYLKACFLYFASFKEDYEIPTEELVRLWTAEGFLKPRGSKEMEEVAEEYLEELVARSLVLVKKKKPNGRIKTCSIHDVLWELSLRKAREEKFSLHITSSLSSMDNYLYDNPRRVSFESSQFNELGYHPHVRSLRGNMSAEELSAIRLFRLLRVLAVVFISENSQLSFSYELASLRYLHIFLSPIQHHSYHPPVTVDESISKPQNLETLIFSVSINWETKPHAYALILPSGIWKMPRLRHLIIRVRLNTLPCPPLSEISSSGLQTLMGITNLDLTRSMTAMLSNLKKLKLLYCYAVSQGKTRFRLDNLVHLHQLKELTILCEYGMKVTHFAFPNKLKKLSLEYTKMPVLKMSVIGSLPNLEVLKLKRGAVRGDEWEPVEGEFVQLKYLKMKNLMLKEWRAESEHFPQLETLIIEDCGDLKEVPAGIGEIDTLQKLVLKGSRAAKESVEKIKAEQESLCNDLLQVIIS